MKRIPARCVVVLCLLCLLCLLCCDITSKQSVTTVRTGQGTDKLFSLSDEELEYIDYLYDIEAPDVADVYVEMLSAYG